MKEKSVLFRFAGKNKRTLFNPKSTKKQSIAAIAASNPDLTILAAAVEAAGLTEVLASPGTYTVFAPTNAAFESLPPGLLDDLIKPQNQQQLREILLYHVLGFEIFSNQLRNKEKLETLEGSDVLIRTKGGVRVNNADVIIPDVRASNGVVHVIDEVLIPPIDKKKNTDSEDKNDYSILIIGLILFGIGRLIK